MEERIDNIYKTFYYWETLQINDILESMVNITNTKEYTKKVKYKVRIKEEM